jgi:hypothetical protein
LQFIKIKYLSFVANFFASVYQMIGF